MNIWATRSERLEFLLRHSGGFSIIALVYQYKNVVGLTVSPFVEWCPVTGVPKIQCLYMRLCVGQKPTSGSIPKISGSGQGESLGQGNSQVQALHFGNLPHLGIYAS